MKDTLLYPYLILIFTNLLIIYAENMPGEERATSSSSDSGGLGQIGGMLPAAPGGLNNVFTQMGSDAAQRATLYMGAFQIMAMPMAGMANLAQQGAGTLMGGLPGSGALAPVAAATNGRRRRRRRQLFLP